MRDIIFRGKRQDGSGWATGYYYHRRKRTGAFGQTVTELDRDADIIIDFRSNACYEVCPESVGQYTGIKDKNGRMIYEGDIIKWDPIEWGSEFSEEVEFDYELLTMRRNDWPQFCEVIGNKYDNPELLKGE